MTIFVPGSITDTCGLCRNRFELQRDPREYPAVEVLEGELWDLVCDRCQAEVTDDDIAALELKTANVGVTMIADLCRRALTGGDMEARAKCVQIILDIRVKPAAT